MTVGTWLKTQFWGKYVGVDEFGNRYFRSRSEKLNKRERRWVLYRGLPEASKVPPEWHAWLHHTVENPLTEEAAKGHAWQRSHVPNLTGTPNTHKQSADGNCDKNSDPKVGDYEPWFPS